MIWVCSQFGVSASSTRVLAHYANPYYLNEFLPTILSNLRRFFSESTPIFFLFQLLLASYYFVYKLRKRENIAAAEVATFIFVSLVVAAYMRTVGWYRYFFPGQVMIFLFTIPGIMTLGKDLAGARKAAYLFAPIAVFALFLLEFLPLSKNALSCNIDTSTATAPYVAKLTKDSPVLFYSVPQLAALYEGNALYQFIKMSDVLQLGKENLELISKNFYSTIFIESKYAAEMEKYKCYKLDTNIKDVNIYHRDPRSSCNALSD